MASYRDFEMLNQAITGFGDAAERRRQQSIVNQREAERIAMEHEMRNLHQQREDRMEQEGTRRFNLQEDRENRRDKQAFDRDNSLDAYFQSDDGKAVLGFKGSWEGVKNYMDGLEKNTGQKWHFTNPPDRSAKKNIGSIHYQGAEGTAVQPFYEGQEQQFAAALQQFQAGKAAEPQVKAVEIYDSGGNKVWVGARDARGNLHPANVNNNETKTTTYVREIPNPKADPFHPDVPATIRTTNTTITGTSPAMPPQSSPPSPAQAPATNSPAPFKLPTLDMKPSGTNTPQARADFLIKQFNETPMSPENRVQAKKKLVAMLGQLGFTLSDKETPAPAEPDEQ